jgi:hypothetical protein
MITGRIALSIKSSFTRDDLKRIAADGDAWRLSLYMPLHRTGREVRQSPILLKDLRSRAAAELEARGCDPATASELLAPIDQVLAETDFSLLQGEGLAILSGKGFADTFLMPIAPPALAVAGRRFQVDPLLPLLFEDGRFHLLALGQNAVRLFEGDRLHLREIPLEGMAMGMRDALQTDNTEPYQGLHSGAPISARVPGIGIYHGHGGGRTDMKDRKKDILDFFRLVDKGIRERIAGSEIPMLLAGVDYLLPLYREASSHPRLLDQAVPGNPEAGQDAQALHAKAWRAYRVIREKEKQESLRLYRERLASPQAVSGLAGVLLAAKQGRVSHLFLQKGYRQPGWFEPAEARVSLANAPDPGTEDLANLACLHALLGGAKVYALEEGEIPEKAEIAALCRY